MVFGHGGNTVTRMPQAQKGIEALDLLVVADPHPTTWAALAPARKNNTYLLPIATSYETAGSRTSSNRAIQWGEQIVKPIFESKDDNEVMYLLAKKLGFADLMFKNIKVENNLPVAEDILREINRGGLSTGYCGQSPERLKSHMAHQADFDMLTQKATTGPNKGDYYGLPWPCWGTPEFKHPGTPLLYNTNLSIKEGGGTFRPRFGLEREETLPDGTKRKVSLLGNGYYSKDSEIKDGYPEFTLRRAQEARLGQGPHRGRARGDQQDQPDQPGRGVLGDRPVGRHPARRDRARLHALRQRQGARQCVRPAGRHPDPPRADLHAAAGARRQVSDAAERGSVPHAEHRLRRAEGGGGEGHRQELPADPHLGPSRRIRRRRRRDAIQQMARRASAGHVHRDQPGGRGRARHQGRRLGLGHRRRARTRRRA